MMNHRYYMKDAGAEGATPAEKAYGMPLFEHLASDEASNTLFNQAMAGHSEMIINKLLEDYRGFEGVDVLVDVGGGTGCTLRMVTAQNKHLRSVNYDLPHVSDIFIFWSLLKTFFTKRPQPKRLLKIDHF